MKKKQVGKIMVITLFMVIAISLNGVFAGPEDTVKVGLIADPETINPIEWRSQNDLAIIMSTHDAILWGVDSKTKMRNLGLAASVKVLPSKIGRAHV